jgi:ASC-1-like (ASCH) protein
LHYGQDVNKLKEGKKTVKQVIQNKQRQGKKRGGIIKEYPMAPYS